MHQHCSARRRLHQGVPVHIRYSELSQRKPNRVFRYFADLHGFAEHAQRLFRPDFERMRHEQLPDAAHARRFKQQSERFEVSRQQRHDPTFPRVPDSKNTNSTITSDRTVTTGETTDNAVQQTTMQDGAEQRRRICAATQQIAYLNRWLRCAKPCSLAFKTTGVGASSISNKRAQEPAVPSKKGHNRQPRLSAKHAPDDHPAHAFL